MAQVIDEPALHDAQTLSIQAQSALFMWWHAHARDLPWRFGRTTPWGVLVSEVMSQQTQMSRVVPYWQAWMERWPDAQSLAQAQKADVLTMWGRLGYPRRALRLQECASIVATQYEDRLPTTYEALIALPGIGDYTASAVMSFAFGERIAVIDTNIRRVLSRAFLGQESLGSAPSVLERTLARIVLPQQEKASVTWNQAIMELGATVCTAKQPQCQDCPLNTLCLFLQAGLPNLAQQRTRPRQKFKGTDRQIRGKIMQALRQESPLSYEEASALCDDAIQLDRCIASLDEDGLIEIMEDHSVRFPTR